jgi:hypothetical protein
LGGGGVLKILGTRASAEIEEGMYAEPFPPSYVMMVSGVSCQLVIVRTY